MWKIDPENPNHGKETKPRKPKAPKEKVVKEKENVRHSSSDGEEECWRRAALSCKKNPPYVYAPACCHITCILCSPVAHFCRILAPPLALFYYSDNLLLYLSRTPRFIRLPDLLMYSTL